jgi:hypothetical protein
LSIVARHTTLATKRIWIVDEVAPFTGADFGVAKTDGRASSQSAVPGDVSAADNILEPAIHIHEDAYGMRSLVPISAYAEAHQDVEKAREAGERNASPTGMGWTDVYVAQAPSTDYSAIPLKLADAVRVFEKYFPRVRRFTATASAGFDPNVKDPFGGYQRRHIATAPARRAL